MLDALDTRDSIDRSIDCLGRVLTSFRAIHAPADLAEMGAGLETVRARS